MESTRFKIGDFVFIQCTGIKDEEKAPRYTPDRLDYVGRIQSMDKTGFVIDKPYWIIHCILTDLLTEGVHSEKVKKDDCRVLYKNPDYTISFGWSVKTSPYTVNDIK